MGSETKRQKVLIFDADAIGREALRAALAAAGFDADAVEDHEAFHKALGRWKPSLVIVELNLPRTGGLELIGSIRERHGALPVILASALVEESLTRLAGEAGADAAFSTLTGYGEIVSCVRRLFARREAAGFAPGRGR